MESSNQSLLRTLISRLAITPGSTDAFDLQDASARAWEHASRNVHFDPAHVSALGFIACDIRWRYSALKATAWDKRTRHAYPKGITDRSQWLTDIEHALQRFNADPDDADKRERAAVQIDEWRATAIALIGAERYTRLVAYEQGDDRSVRTCQWACRARALLRRLHNANERLAPVAAPISTVNNARISQATH